MILHCDQKDNIIFELLNDSEDLQKDISFLKSKNFNFIEKNGYFEVNITGKLKFSLLKEKLIFIFEPR